jgi:hypothetical protein
MDRQLERRDIDAYFRLSLAWKRWQQRRRRRSNSKNQVNNFNVSAIVRQKLLAGRSVDRQLDFTLADAAAAAAAEWKWTKRGEKI